MIAHDVLAHRFKDIRVQAHPLNMFGFPVLLVREQSGGTADEDLLLFECCDDPVAVELTRIAHVGDKGPRLRFLYVFSVWSFMLYAAGTYDGDPADGTCALSHKDQMVCEYLLLEVLFPNRRNGIDVFLKSLK